MNRSDSCGCSSVLSSFLPCGVTPAVSRGRSPVRSRSPKCGSDRAPASDRGRLSSREVVARASCDIALGADSARGLRCIGAARTCHGEEKRAVPCGPSGDPSSHLPANYPDALLVVTAPTLESLRWSAGRVQSVQSSSSSHPALSSRGARMRRPRSAGSLARCTRR